MKSTLLHDYVDFVSQYSEASKFAHTWAFLTCVSAYVGRDVHLPFGMSNLYANLYTLFVASTGSRKSAAIKSAKSMLTGTGYDAFAANTTTKVTLFSDLSKAAVKDTDGFLNFNTECFICADEFQNFIGLNNIDFAMALGELWDIDGDYTYRSNTGGKLKLSSPYFTILGGTTPSGFRTAFPQGLNDQGFLTRLLLINVPSPVNAFHLPPIPDERTKTEILKEFKKLKQFATSTHRITCSPEADTLLKTIYSNYKPGLNSKFDGYLTRRYTHLLKLCILTTILLNSQIITSDAVLFANALLGSAELKMPSTMGLLLSAKDGDDLQLIYNTIAGSKGGISFAQIVREVFDSIGKIERITELLRTLCTANKVKIINLTRDGKPVGAYILNKEPQVFTVNQKTMLDIQWLDGLLDTPDFQLLQHTK